jgi:glycosyltransferase involved in cell wall biosynthesis
VRILFLSRWFPYPPDNGSKIRIFNILRQLAGGHELNLFALAGPEDVADSRRSRALQELCARVTVLPHREFRRSSPRALAGFISRQPRFLFDTYQPEVAAAVIEAARSYHPDVVIASQIDMVPYALHIATAPLVLEELELSAYFDAAVGSVRGKLTMLKLQHYLASVLPRFAACTVASEREYLNLHSILPTYTRATVIPNAVDVAQYRGDFGPVQPSSLVFSGALTYGSNEDAMGYFLREIYPRVRAEVPAAHLRITGSHPVAMARLFAGPGVELTGHVPDIRPLIARSYVSVVPLRLGGGTRLKILEAMALGTPVVSTGKGAEGLDVSPGEDIALADSPAGFAEAIVRLFASHEDRERLSAAGRRLVRRYYDWPSVGNKLMHVLDSVGQSSDRVLV